MNKNRKGFTIVELVIVIAIIAILAAVLIPTFASLIQKANISKDTQVIRNLNTAIATATEKPETMRDALKIAAEAGYLVDKINAAANGNDILWDSENKVFCYYNVATGTPAYIPETKVDNAKTPVYKFWKVYDEKHPVPEADKQTYSVYWAGTAVPNETTYKVGFDAGNCTEALTITYTNTTAGQNVMFYMNGGNLTVKDETKSTQSLYGFVAEADITTANECFYVYGTVAKAAVKAGTVIAKKNSILVVDSAAKDSTVKKDGGIVMAADANKTFAGTVTVSDETEKGNFALEISDAAGLAAFRDSVNAGMTYEGLTVKLTADIDLSTQGNWNPIGNRYALNNDNNEKKAVDTTTEAYKAYRKAFMGTFDGQGHTISGLFINTADASYKGVKKDKSDSTYAALFGYVDKATVKNFTVNGLVSGCDVAGVIGILGEGCTVDGIVSNVTVGGKTGENEEKLARGKAGGLINMTKGDGSTIKNCTNNGRVTSTKKDNGIGDYAGGIIALIQHDNITIENCKNTGDISTYAYYVGGIVGAASDTASGRTQFKVEIKKCENTGNITLTDDSVNTKNDGVGAIIGACGANSAVTISDGCTNKGTISGKATYDNDSLVGVNYPGDNGKDVTGVTKKS